MSRVAGAAALLARLLCWRGCFAGAAASRVRQRCWHGARRAAGERRAYVMPDPATSTLPLTSSAVPDAHCWENDVPSPLDTQKVPSADLSIETLVPVQSNDD